MQGVNGSGAQGLGISGWRARGSSGLGIQHKISVPAGAVAFRSWYHIVKVPPCKCIFSDHDVSMLSFPFCMLDSQKTKSQALTASPCTACTEAGVDFCGIYLDPKKPVCLAAKACSRRYWDFFQAEVYTVWAHGTSG